ncbi:MAG: hypothetical protein QW059_03680 [Nitrososphaerota archaeon]
MVEVHGYVSGIRPRSAGTALVTLLSISTLSGEGYVAVLPDPPEWLDIGSKVTCNIEQIPGREKTLSVVAGLKPSTTLPDIVHVELVVESVRETPSGHILLEGKREDGGFFSYLLTPENVNIDAASLPCRAVALKATQRGVERVIAVLPVKNFQIMKRAKELMLRLRELEEQRPEQEFLKGPP